VNSASSTHRFNLLPQRDEECIDSTAASTIATTTSAAPAAAVMTKGSTRPDVHPSLKRKLSAAAVKCDQHQTTECGICNVKRPLSAHHCHDCGVCVDELDHHCPCKCQPINPQSFTLIFTIYIYISNH
jgi:DHHC palmitoyltransferase